MSGTCHDIHFTRGKYDVVVDCTLPSQNAVRVLAAIKASGGFEIADYVEIVDIDAVKTEVQKIAKPTPHLTVDEAIITRVPALNTPPLSVIALTAPLR